LDRRILEQVHVLIDGGRTVDEIHTYLLEMGANISRSAVGRYRKSAEDMAQEIRQTRMLADTVVRSLENAPEEKTTRLNIELLEGAILTLQQTSGDKLDAKAAVLLSRATKNLVQAKGLDAALTLRLREEGRKQAMEEVAERIKAMGSAKDLKELTDEELERRIAELVQDGNGH
jgi:transcriptional antiterminator Rof (Rho-off)